MKFLLMLHNNPAVLNALGSEEQQKLMDGHGAFIESIQRSGELIVTQALGDPSQSAVVRVRNGVPVVSDGHIELNVEGGSKLGSAWEIHTSDGSVRASIPGDLKADMDVDTGDGHIDSDIPITVQGSLSRNHLRGTLNGGGPLFRIHTGDGSVHLSRR